MGPTGCHPAASTPYVGSGAPSTGTTTSLIYNLSPVRFFFPLEDAAAEPRVIETITEAVEKIEKAGRQKRRKALVEEICWKTGFNGYAMFFCPSYRRRTMYPNMKYFRGLGPMVSTYDVMPLILLNVVPNLWRLLSGKCKTSDGSAHQWAISEAIVTAAGLIVAAARATVALEQARCFWSIATHSKSYKAMDWMFYTLSTWPAVLAGRIPDEAYAMFMSLPGHFGSFSLPFGRPKRIFAIWIRSCGSSAGCSTSRRTVTIANLQELAVAVWLQSASMCPEIHKLL